MRVVILAEKGSVHGTEDCEALQAAGHSVVLCSVEVGAWKRLQQLRRGFSIRGALRRRVARARVPAPDVETHVIRDLRQDPCPSLLVEADVALAPDVGYIQKGILALPEHGFINAHPGLLPGFRGNTPMEWSMLCGETLGVTVHQMVPEVDAGLVFRFAYHGGSEFTKGVTNEESIAELHATLNKLALEAICEVLSWKEWSPGRRQSEIGPAFYWPPIPKQMLPLCLERWKAPG
ncbi:hypothetical protein LCGC14_2529980 [marine sediment metagenome]|uniref:Formyl transferase N-terminal domain-containing protein n=1 Tax=marine sediment metagenome TaxID=412755 RepID=A0A0F9D5E2_9ZZZZ